MTLEINLPWLYVPACFRILTMVSGRRLADIGYRAFSASMMLLSVYGGYLCAVRGYRYMQRRKQLKLAAENQDLEAIKDWRQRCCSSLSLHTFSIHLAKLWTPPPPFFLGMITWFHSDGIMSSQDVLFRINSKQIHRGHSVCARVLNRVVWHLPEVNIAVMFCIILNMPLTTVVYKCEE